MLNRAIFVGAGTIGVNAVFKTKRRLGEIVGPDQGSLLKTTELSHNPFQFLVLHDGGPDGGGIPTSQLFMHKRVSGLDDDLFHGTHEIVNIKEEPDRLLDTFKASLRNLLAFNPQTYYSMTGIDTSILPPAVLLVLDIDLWKNESWKAALIKLLNPEDSSLYDGAGNLRYHIHAIVFCPRQQSNRGYAKEFLTFVNSLYFFDSEGPFPLQMPDDAIEQAANFLSMAALLDDSGHRNFFDSASQKRCFSFGSSRLHYPKNQMVNDAALLNLGDPDFGQAGGYGKWFYKCFLGEFTKKAHEGPDDTFAIGDEDRSTGGGGPDEYRPTIRPESVNRAQQLYTEAEQWLEDHCGSIKKHLEKDSLLKRISELTRPLTFFKIFVEKWHDSLDFLDFLMKNEVLLDARLRSEKISADFSKRWLNKSTDLYSRARKIINDEGGFLSEHPGETTWELSRNIISHVRDNMIASYRNRKADTEYQPSEAPKRSEVEKEIKKLPHPASLLSRLIIFTAIMVFGWPGFHFLLAKWKFESLFSIPPWITGLAAGVPFIIVAFWLAYGKKVKDIRTILGLYLLDRQRAWEEQIEKAEKELVVGFLTNCMRHIKTEFVIREGFFYQLIDQKKLSFEDMQDDDYDNFSTPLNTLETCYLNRFILYTTIQKMLPDALKYDAYVLSAPIPDPIEDAYKQIVETKAIQAEDCRKILSSKTIADALESDTFWKTVLTDKATSSENGNDPAEQQKDPGTIAQSISKSIICRVCSNIEELFDADSNHKDLASYLLSIDFQMPRETKMFLLGRSETTFRMTTEPIPKEKIFSGSTAYFPGDDNVNEVLDKNCILYFKIEGPVAFDDILWREDDVSTSI